MIPTAKYSILFCLLLLLSGCAAIVDEFFNSTTLEPPYQATPQANRLHNTLHTVDLHADPLLWNRDLLQRGRWGHVDLPRLQEGHVALQVFGVVSGVPFPLRMENNRDKRDLINLLAYLQDWPANTHKSRLQRSLYQADKLAQRIKASKGALMMIKTRIDLESLLQQRNRGVKTIGAVLSLEGAHALEGDVNNIEKLYQAGFRIIGLVHLFDNDIAGSAHGADRYGLTDKGRQLIRKLLKKNMLIDLAHASAQTLDEVLTLVDRPVIASHGGVKGTCQLARNLEDRHVKGIAQTGGVIGIGIYEYATCGQTLQDAVKAMRYVAELVGVEHVALGTDFDGLVETVVDASGLALLTQALMEGGFSDTDIAAIMGGNALRVLRSVLPEATD